MTPVQGLGTGRPMHVGRTRLHQGHGDQFRGKGRGAGAGEPVWRPALGGPEGHWQARRDLEASGSQECHRGKTSQVTTLFMIMATKTATNREGSSALK